MLSLFLESYPIARNKMGSLFLTIGFVMVCELLNTVAETLVDMITKDYSPEAKKAKDLAAGAVLASAITAILVGILIFFEPVYNLIKSLFSQ